MKTNRALVAVASIGLLSFVGTASAETIYACAKKSNGQLRIVDAPGQCLKSEFQVSWEDSQGQSSQINELLGRVASIEAALGVINEAPIVDAGGDFAILITMDPSMPASVTDDGLVEPLTFSWELVSGPGDAVFDDPLALTPRVTFSTVGTYELQISVNDGAVTVTDGIQIVVHPFNTPPTIIISSPQVVPAERIVPGGLYIPQRLQCEDVVPEVIVEDDGLPSPTLHFEWTVDEVSVVPSTWSQWNQVTAEFSSQPTDSSNWPLTLRSVENSIYNYLAREIVADLTISVSDGYHNEERQHRIVCSVSASERPFVDAGPDLIAQGHPILDGYQCDNLEVLGTATDDGLPSPLEITWSSSGLTPTPDSRWRAYFDFSPNDQANTTLVVRVVNIDYYSDYVPPSVSATLHLVANDGWVPSNDQTTVTCTAP